MGYCGIESFVVCWICSFVIVILDSLVVLCTFVVFGSFIVEGSFVGLVLMNE